ncbi:MAG TPA: alcohol dehydrogenase catalytic domain-containing protein [Candidatus Hydrogenedentes bacterium]|nr:alcohol dehydrogenase catalytic domain-containing protein [Candidatus Hydrogenedentota bacterium]HOL76846.1 alcohol dehydrogenase catalytic domain-containing protein [Candidatus Hydrogenedentota bacterium]HPO86212.1 alcohol dehydrogenase catalytic domain-containing protein [Candidatus Hydrogenedentota bacterium]
MRALWFDSELRLDDVPVPQPQKGEALIRVLAAGICNTDLEITKGYMKFTGIPGHEFVGIVEKSPDEYWVGKRVVGEINCPCGVCTYCRLEMPRHCPNRSVLGIQNRNGAFAEFLTLPVNNLHLVPNSIRDDVAVFTEPLAAAFRILEQTQITGEHRVLILGDGKLAQLVAQVIWLKTKRVQCVGKHESKVELLRRLGIPCMLYDEPVEPGADVVVEATGSKEGLTRAMELVRPEGTIVLKTTVAGTHELAMSIPVIQEIKIVGSRCGPFRPALDALAVGIVEVRPLITEIFGIEHAVQAFQRAAQPDAMKVIVHM